MKSGERIWNQERLFNIRAGFDRTHDTLPARFFDDPVSDGPSQGQVSKADEMLPAYYELRGWSNQGEPKPETLERLEL
jgi:aldehyde:ferredoxin oxidoreductase